MDKFITIPSSDTRYTLYYRDEGVGQPVLLLHGFAEDNTVWDNQVHALSTACRLILPDLPGSGRSSALSSPASVDGRATIITIEGMATIIKGLLDRLNIDKVTMIGHSMGGYITLAFAALYPQRLTAFGLFHSTAYPDSEDKKAARRKAIDFIRTNGSAPFIRQSTPNLFSPVTREHQPQLIEAMIARYSGFIPDSLIAYYEAMIARPDRTDVLRQSTCPVLFIIGKDDSVIPVQQALEQSYLPSLSHLHLIPGTGHQAMLENPEMSNQLLRDFINFVSRI
ncbi:MAG TPA: alpha/beta hydrolase [Puia sp.]|nr:alpha/beta hydrolase [Puia sp.]